MEFEWDEAKRLENFHRRGVDFALAAVVFEDPVRFEIEDIREDYGESRRMVIGSYEGETYVFVFTMRENVCRVIPDGRWVKVAEEDIRRYTSDELKAMVERGDYMKTPPDAPTIELDEAFWKRLEEIGTMPGRVSVHLRLDAKTEAFFRKGGRGHLTRMANVLKAYAESRS